MAKHSFRAQIALVACAAVVTLVACDDGAGGTRAGQLMSSPSASLPVTVSPFQLQLAPLPLASCPASQPFATHFDLVLGPTMVDLVVDAVTLNLNDLSGASVVFLSDDLQRLFGPLKIPAGRTRTFTLRPNFGCGLSTTPGSLIVTVTAVDLQGLQHNGTATVAFR